MDGCLRRLIGLAASVLLPLLPLACANTAKRDTTKASEATGSSFHDLVKQDVNLAKGDLENMYSPIGLGALAVGIAGAAPLANGSADGDVQRWYQERIHREGLDPVSTVTSIAGQVWVVVPVGLEFARVMGHVDEEAVHDGGLFEWSNRSLRACAVGYPPILALFGILGASRPEENTHSGWHPFQDFHGVSGHTFVGAVPFLTAAKMTDNPFLQVPLVAASFAVGWTRIHDEKHYLSQVVLGWWIAALATWAVDQTQESAFTVKPTVTPEGAGIGVEVRY